MIESRNLTFVDIINIHNERVSGFFLSRGLELEMRKKKKQHCKKTKKKIIKTCYCFISLL